jgi:hypothetical protein
LGDQRIDLHVAPQRDHQRSAAVDVLSVEERIAPGSLGARSKASHDGRIGVGVVDSRQKVLDLERKRIREHDEVRFEPRVHAEEFTPRLRAPVELGKLRSPDPVNGELHSGQMGGDHAHPWLVLQLQVRSDHAVGGAADRLRGPEVFPQSRKDSAVVEEMVLARKDER